MEISTMEKVHSPESNESMINAQVAELASRAEKLNASLEAKRDGVGEKLRTAVQWAYGVAITLVPHDMRDVVDTTVQVSYQNLINYSRVAMDMLQSSGSSDREPQSAIL